jgi:dephospho-CoA kinase
MERAVGSAAASGASFVVVEAIRLVEAGYALRCDEVWLVTCTPEEQRGRLARRGLAADEIERRMATQGADLSERLRPHATRVVDAGGPLKGTIARAAKALEEALAARPAAGSPSSA